MRFPDVVVIDGLITGVVLGSPNGDDYREDELWVATVDPMGVNQFTWIAKSRLTKKEPPPSPRPTVLSGPSPETAEMLQWIKYLAKQGYDDAESGTQAELCLQMISERLHSVERR